MEPDLSAPNVATARRAVVYPRGDAAATIASSKVVVVKIALRALAINPKEQLMIQVELTDKKLPITG